MMSKKININRSNLIFGDVRLRYPRLITTPYYWSADKPKKGKRPKDDDIFSNTMKPNGWYPQIQIPFFNEEEPPVDQYDILCAYLDTSPCGTAGGCTDWWLDGFHAASKKYYDGSLSSGPVIPNAGTGYYSWCPVFGALSDGTLIIYNGGEVLLESSPGSGSFSIAGTISGTSGDPCFLKLNDDRTKIVIGIGYGQPLIIFPVSILNTSSPPVLLDCTSWPYVPHADVINYDYLNYYDGIFWNDDTILINGGTFTASEVNVLDVSATPMSSDISDLIVSIPGASAGLVKDNNGNLITGIGYSSSSGTGELRYFSGSTIDSLISGGSTIAYSTGTYIATVLSAGQMVVDQDNYLYVGGADFLGITGPDPDVPNTDTAGFLAKVSLYDGAVTKIYIDPCQDDTATGPLCLIPK